MEIPMEIPLESDATWLSPLGSSFDSQWSHMRPHPPLVEMLSYCGCLFV